MDDLLHDAPPLLAPAARAYARRLAHHGATARGVYWRDEEWQRRRYHILVKVFAPEDRRGGVTINDFGCGYGAFFDYLANRSVMAGSRYVGYDMSADMIDACKARVADPRARFVRHFIATEGADYSFASGTFNLRIDADDDAWTDYVLAGLRQLWSMTGKALAFNMLNRVDGDDSRQNGLYYADAERFADFCRRELSADVTQSIDTPLPDWTIFVRR